MNYIPKNPVGHAALAVILTIAVIMVSGCTGTSEEAQDPAAMPGGTLQEKPFGIGTTMVTAGTLVQPATVQHTGAPDPSAPYITFDPIGDKKIGDLLIFSGTTNLPEKTPVNLYWAVGSTEEKMVSNREVFAGGDGVRRWRFVSDSGGFEPGIYSVRVATGKNDVTGSAQFTLSGTSLRPKDVIYYSGAGKLSGGTPSITVNPIDDHRQGDVFLITGTSGLEEGTLLLCNIYPLYFEDRTKRPATMHKGPSGSASDTIVIRGSGGLKRWSVAIDTNAFEKTDYIVNVSTVSEDFSVQEIFGRAQFALS